MKINNIELEVTKTECYLDIFTEDGRLIVSKSEPLKYYIEDGSFYPDGQQFDELELSEEAREYIDRICIDFISNMDIEDFAPTDMR